jgi:hypothetical protein
MVMSHRPWQLFVLLVVAAISSTASALSEGEAGCREIVAALRETLSLSAQEQAARAINANDLRYLEWYGLGSMIPGIKSQSCARNANIVKPFEGTSDALCSPEHSRLYDASYSYAEAYNRLIALERELRGLPNCGDA